MARIFPAQRVPAELRAHFWIETIALVSAIACILAIVIAALGAAAGTAAGEAESGQQGPPSNGGEQTYEGVITDTHCGAKHSAIIGKSAADCTRVCVHTGEEFALVDGDAVYLLEGNPDTLKRVAGQRVRIVGQLSGKKISVTSVVATAKSRVTDSESQWDPVVRLNG